MREINKIAESLFEKIRDRFEDVTLGDENAKATQEPEEARFFNFDYVSEGHDYGNITLSLIDENSLKVYFSKNIGSDLDEEQKTIWYGFLRELREFAKRNLLSFEPRDITRSTLKHRDLQQVSNADSTYAKDEVVSESRLHGTSRSSYENDGNVRIIVRHSQPVVDEVRGARARHINSIFVETHDGERFKLPHNNLKYARAMARHISEGGSLMDDFGQHITRIAEECGKLRPFKSAMVRRTFEDAETQSMVEAAFEYHGLLNNALKRIGGRKGYAACKEHFHNEEHTLMDDYDADSMRERFVKRTYNDKMEDALPLVQKAYKMKKENKFAEQFESWANNVAEGTWAKPEGEDQVSELIDLLSEPLIVGVDAQNATNALYNIIGDDRLFDQLGQLAEVNPDADARDVVMAWVEENMPEIYGQIMSTIGDEDTPDQYSEGDTYGASGMDDPVVDEDNSSSDCCEAVQSAIIRRIINQHKDLLVQHGPQAIMDAARDVAEWVGDVEEIGSSDVSAYVQQVVDQLEGSSEVAEGRMKEVDMDLTELSDEEFQAKYGKSKEEMKAALAEGYEDHVNKDEKLKRMGAKPLSFKDKLKTIPHGIKAMAKGEPEDDVSLYNKQFNEDIAQMRKIAGLK